MTETERERAGRRDDRGAAATRDVLRGTDADRDCDRDDRPVDEAALGGGDDARTGPTARCGAEPTPEAPEAHDAYYVTDPGDTEVH
ncbi:hypothetical protein J2752_001739 [Halarchaeum rubridurum]|uniref:Uncharacterized protein n=1 Tax=Halarchaeum rubridurum TaxID=489911 RepID=A0A830FQ73_9EURY|nr:hypothetical protein [Halarchaeum rubridurum]MBP1954827.1 hypothetical protein [Halarchaeum rubridurum]GGM60051.1 hypothetical protein GCM10009017_07770 [Halarchaeum rubridurum]